ncbi:MAG TPA: tRNA (guanosine(37)-N1)-methyltransferase TrmD [Nannocystaceae bacterium]|nr:tRNA (guanosine(37)-N1)-methyltransferase TrmD [Nannocystaceae bacterium]
MTTAFEVLTLFPEAVRAFVGAGLLGKAIERGLVEVHCTDPREHTEDRHRVVDDAPFGGGAGMVIKAQPVVTALEAVIAARGPMHRILLTPSAPRFDQRVAERLATLPRIALVCGRYEGIDDRVREHWVDECLSLGDFVLGGGEVAALAIIEAVSRLREGVVGNPESVARDSFADDEHGILLEHPQYTRPAVFRGHAVPQVLLGGDHAAIARWRREAALARTWALRPELRPQRSLPTLPIHLAIDGTDPQHADEWAALARTHAVAGIVLLGADADAALAWSSALAHGVQITAFEDTEVMRRRFRRRGAEPWIVALAEPGTPGAAGRVPELADRLRTCARVQPQALVLVAPGLSASADAIFAPEPGGTPARAQEHDPALAPAAAIVDSSRPLAALSLCERALSSLVTP